MTFPRHRRNWARRRLATLKHLAHPERLRIIAALPPPAVAALAEEWWWGAHGGQEEPKGDWRVWPIIAGRGFGKTRAGAEWVWQRARDHPGARIALVGATLDDVERVMVEGDSGLIESARHDEAPRWISDRGVLHFPGGATAHAFSAARPAKLRGPQHHFAWCDELAKWPHADATWDNLMLGLRLGERPRTIVTTTPQAMPLLKRILALPRCSGTGGRTDENIHSAADFRAAMAEMYGGTRLGRQELDGELFDDVEGALWTREMLDKGRAEPILGHGGDSRFHARSEDRAHGGAESDCPRMVRVVVGVDPPASTTGDACGIVVCGLGEDDIAYVLADLTASGLSPEGWARRVAEAAASWDAQKVIAEKNQGGDMIESMLLGVDSGLPVRLASASKGKAARAEPVALRFETGKARLAGSFPALEDELCAMTYQGYCGPGSPDRADAMVWAMAELIRPERGPRIARL